MIAIPFGWFEDEQPRDLIRWAAAAAIVLGVHAPSPRISCRTITVPIRFSTH